ncbi:uncharacterized protein LOC123320929 isoform X4 [Coccinella septempunctata]|uniref:uncharacterized protein LOC123320929 isoform X4 n=1 Tax=Coccinella septempunctata TaxID=41139 RepID=UPI001D069DDC|nr:uncharacterized protein LOC123320929 isoform X4 [Coccinella septempunctata]
MLTKGFLLLLYFIPFLRRLFECSNKKIVIPFVNNLDEFYWYRGAFGFGHCGRSLLATSTNTGYTDFWMYPWIEIQEARANC